jgi:hypothetical protein
MALLWQIRRGSWWPLGSLSGSRETRQGVIDLPVPLGRRVLVAKGGLGRGMSRVSGKEHVLPHVVCGDSEAVLYRRLYGYGPMII